MSIIASVSAVALEDVMSTASIFGIVALGTLIAFLVAKELSGYGNSGGKTLRYHMNVAIVPLIVVFGMVVLMKVLEVIL